jgi:chemotaxis protein methyltransferase CheR
VNAPAAPGQLERFRALVANRLGLQFEDARMAWLADVLRRRMDVNGQPAEAYLARLQGDAPRSELAALAQELTVAETYFFRNIDQFHALREHVLPQRWHERGARRCLRILSAGCASGEEAYSIAMTLRELSSDAARNASIRAVDLNPAVLDKARRARYTAWALRETPPAQQQRWFRQDGRDLVLDDAIRGAVTFEERNLAEDDAELWSPGAYDLVFCRNVLMYFTPQVAQAVVARIARALAPGGTLFLGHAETLRGLSQAFHLRHTHGSFYYQRKEAGEPASAPALSEAGVLSAAGPALAAAVEGSDSWVEAIGAASERVRALTDTRAAPGAAAAPTAPRWHLGQALELFQRERFVEALGLVRGLPAEAARDPDVLLLHAVLLAHSGEFASAEETCHRLLAIDELNAGAHYVLALCREGAGDRRGAADRDQLAIYLDPAFAMPRMHLGLLARRAGDHETLRRELGQALVLLQREDAARLLLFGGGFNREALLALCRAELLACGRAVA